MSPCPLASALIRFVETPIFTRQVHETMADDEYRRLQAVLIENPELGGGAGAGGLRKLRWGIEGRGKRGGVRVLYYWARRDGVILMLYLFPKNEQDDLTDAQKRHLLDYVKREYP